MNTSFTGQNIDMAFRAVRAGYGGSRVPASPITTKFLKGALRQLDVDGGRSGWTSRTVSEAECIEWGLEVLA